MNSLDQRQPDPRPDVPTFAHGGAEFAVGASLATAGVSWPLLDAALKMNEATVNWVELDDPLARDVADAVD